MLPDLVLSLMSESILRGSATSQMILAVGPLKNGVARESLETGVHNAALTFAMYQDPINSSDRVRDAEALADACRMVLVRLGLTVEARREDQSARKPVAWRSLKRSLGAGALFTGGDSVLSAINAIQNLEGMADRIASHYRPRISSNGLKRGAPKNKALGTLFRELEGLYFEVWDDVPALARSSVSGDWREADPADGVIPESYETGEEFPIRFLNFLTRTFQLFASRGMDVPTTSGSVEQACRRWRREQIKLAEAGTGEESDYDAAVRLSKEFRGD